MTMPDLKRLVLAAIGLAARLATSEGGATLDLRPKAPLWFHLVTVGSLFVFLGALVVIVPLVAGAVTWLSVAFGSSVVVLGSALLWLASVLRARSLTARPGSTHR